MILPQDLHHGACELGAGLHVLHREEGLFVAGRDDVGGGVFAQACQGGEGEADLAVLGDVLVGGGLFQIYGEKANAAGVGLVDQLEDREALGLLGGGLVLLGTLFNIGDVVRHGLLTSHDQRAVKAQGLDGEHGAVKGQGDMHLVPAQADGRHIVGGGVGLGEHVLDLLTGGDVPVGHANLPHFGFVLGGQSLALTHHFHDLEGVGFLHSVADESQHDIVSRSDNLGNVTGSVGDQLLGIARPHVGAVGETRDLKQIREGLGLTFLQHLDDEAGAQLGKTQGAQGTTDLLGGGSQGLGTQEQLVDGAVVHGHVQNRGIGILFQVLILGGHIVSQLVQLEEGIVEVLEGEVGGDDIRVGIVSGVLDGAEIVDLQMLGDNHDTAGVLARGALDTHAMGGQAVDLGAVDADLLVLQVLHDETEGSLLRHAADGARAEDVLRAEQLLGVLMNLTLHLTREVQVDIGGFVSVEA